MGHPDIAPAAQDRGLSALEVFIHAAIRDRERESTAEIEEESMVEPFLTPSGVGEEGGTRWSITLELDPCRIQGAAVKGYGDTLWDWKTRVGQAFW